MRPTVFRARAFRYLRLGSKVQETGSFISAEHLGDIRRRIAESIGLA